MFFRQGVAIKGKQACEFLTDIKAFDQRKIQKFRFIPLGTEAPTQNLCPHRMENEQIKPEACYWEFTELLRILKVQLVQVNQGQLWKFCINKSPLKQREWESSWNACGQCGSGFKYVVVEAECTACSSWKEETQTIAMTTLTVCLKKGQKINTSVLWFCGRNDLIAFDCALGGKADA